jgi:hypothetical protein
MYALPLDGSLHLLHEEEHLETLAHWGDAVKDYGSFGRRILQHRGWQEEEREARIEEGEVLSVGE